VSCQAAGRSKLIVAEADHKLNTLSSVHKNRTIFSSHTEPKPPAITMIRSGCNTREAFSPTHLNMAYETLVIEDLATGTYPCQCNPRGQADLPDSITGRGAIWQMPNWSATGQLIPTSYYAYNDHDRKYQPVEFINNRWYFIQWDDSIEFWGYWAFLNGDIP
jgi:hypothetical protein